MLINIFYIFQADGELRTYGSATELTGSTATVIMIKHGDLLCANLGKILHFSDNHLSSLKVMRT